jgi:hypothetical protein
MTLFPYTTLFRSERNLFLGQTKLVWVQGKAGFLQPLEYLL